MEKTINELEGIIEKYQQLLWQLTEETLSAKPNPAKWSRKEIIGHLVDSALNNARRFVVAQYEEAPHIVYAQDTWVKASGYQQYDSKELIQLWVLINKHICSILAATPQEMYNRTCLTQQVHTIEWLAADYNKHLLHHLHAVLDLEPIPYP